MSGDEQQSPVTADDVTRIAASAAATPSTGPTVAYRLQSGEQPSAESAPGPPSQVWGGYDILDEVARGGMGVVYRARQRKLNRLVALKVILAGSHAGPEDLDRFRIEAETIARLQHPNIVQIHEVGEHGGLPFLSLEFCSGGNLARILDGTPRPPRDAALLVETLARAMEAAHRANVVHRDLKPANVLFTGDDTPKVTDFGLAKKLDDQSRTQTGAIMGTPSYMAPEQAAGRHDDVGPAVDIYALGAVLYECLTGRAPFKAASSLETLRQVVHDEPVPPLRIQPRIPRDLDTIALKCLRKEPSRRYATAAELADDLRRYLNDEPVLARPVGRIERTIRWCRRNPPRAAAALLGVLLLVGAIVVPVVLAVSEARNARELAWEQQKTKDALAAALQAEREKTEKLWQSNLDRARAGRASRLIGQRFQSLKAIREAAAIRPDLQLRNEAIACLALVDLRAASSDAVFEPPERPHSAGPGRLVANSPILVRRARVEGNDVVVELLLRSDLRLAHPRPPDFLLWSPDGAVLAVACSDRIVYLWDIADGRLITTLEGLNSGLSLLEFHPSGQMLLTGGFDQTSRLFDPVSGRVLVRSLDSYHPGPFSRDGSLLHNGGNLMEIALGHECRVLPHGEPGTRGSNAETTSGPWETEFSDDGRMLAAWGADGPRVWDPATGRRLAYFRRGTTTDGGGCFLGSNRICFSGPAGAVVRDIARDPDDARRIDFGEARVLWARPDSSPLPPERTGFFASIPAGSRRMRASRDGTWVAMAQPELNRAIAVRSDDPNVQRTFEGQKWCSFVALSPDGRWLATGSWSWDPSLPVRVWDVESGRLVHEIAENSYAMLNFSPDGRWLVLGSQREYCFWEVGSWQRGLRIPRRSNLVGPAAFSRDGRMMAIVPSNMVVRLIDPRDGTELATLTPPEPKLVSDLRFSPDGQRLAVATENNTVYLWDLRSIRGELRGMGLDWEASQAEAAGLGR